MKAHPFHIPANFDFIFSTTNKNSTGSLCSWKFLFSFVCLKISCVFLSNNAILSKLPPQPLQPNLKTFLLRDTLMTLRGSSNMSNIKFLHALKTYHKLSLVSTSLKILSTNLRHTVNYSQSNCQLVSGLLSTSLRFTVKSSQMYFQLVLALLSNISDPLPTSLRPIVN